MVTYAPAPDRRIMSVPREACWPHQGITPVREAAISVRVNATVSTSKYAENSGIDSIEPLAARLGLLRARRPRATGRWRGRRGAAARMARGLES